MKRDSWIALIWLYRHGTAEQWAAAMDAIRLAQGSALLAQALEDKDPDLPAESLVYHRGRVWHTVGIQDKVRYI